jgi:hypothetical protein
VCQKSLKDAAILSRSQSRRAAQQSGVRGAPYGWAMATAVCEGAARRGSALRRVQASGCVGQRAQRVQWEGGEKGGRGRGSRSR